MKNRHQRKQVFEDTRQIIDSETTWKDSFRFYNLSKFSNPPKHGNENTIYKVVEADCLDVAFEMKARGLNPAVLVNASHKRPGGGVQEGSSAQEEDLFRRTTLSYLMFHQKVKDFYPVTKPLGFDLRDVTVLKDTNYDLCKRWTCGFVFLPAIARPELTLDFPPRLKNPDPIQHRICNILRLAHLGQYDSLVLGAWGCGVFKNPPQHIAELFHEALQQYKGIFKEIHFAILDSKPDSHNPEGNLKPFQKIFDFGL